MYLDRAPPLNGRYDDVDEQLECRPDESALLSTHSCSCEFFDHRKRIAFAHTFGCTCVKTLITQWKREFPRWAGGSIT